MRIAAAPRAGRRPAGRRHRPGRGARSRSARRSSSPLTKMNRILEVDARQPHRVGGAGRRQPRPHQAPRAARLPLRPRPVEPAGVHDRRQRGQQLRRAALPRLRRHQRPRPSRSRWCSPTATSPMLGGLDAEPAGLDLRGVFVGGEGTLGIATRIAVRSHQEPPAVRTLLLSFDRVRDAANTVSAVIAAGIVPAAMEVMDHRITVAVENYVHAGYPTDAAAVLLVEVDGLDRRGRDRRRPPSPRSGWTTAPPACGRPPTDAERAAALEGPQDRLRRHRPDRPRLLPARHRRAHGRSWPTCSSEVYAIAERHELIVMNVFHAGDGNLHPLLLFDGREPGVLDRVHAAGAEIVAASLDAGGVLSGEHGIGVEKQAYMDAMFSDDDLDHQNRLRQAFDPTCRANPGKVLPIGSQLRRHPGAAARAHRGLGMTAEPSWTSVDRRRGAAGVRRRGRPRRPDRRRGRRHPLGRSAVRSPAARRVVAGAGRHRRLPARGDDGAGPRRHDRRRAARRARRARAAHRRSSSGAAPSVARSPSARTTSTCSGGGRCAAVGAAGALRVGRGADRHRRRPDGQERHRLRPAPADGRLARHARACWPR